MAQRVVNDVLYLDVVLSDDSENLSILLDDGSQELEIEMLGASSGGGGSILPYYNGVYEVNPRKIEQTLLTSNKSMSRDVIIHPISYSETINESGGLTVVIGQE